MKKLEPYLVHAALLLAVAFALYPLLWVLSTALSHGGLGESRAIPWPKDPSLDNFRAVVSTGVFARQVANSVLASAATALASVALATPAAYALARFPFVGKKASMRVLLATQMFPGIDPPTLRRRMAPARQVSCASATTVKEARQKMASAVRL